MTKKKYDNKNLLIKIVNVATQNNDRKQIVKEYDNENFWINPG